MRRAGASRTAAQFRKSTASSPKASKGTTPSLFSWAGSKDDKVVSRRCPKPLLILLVGQRALTVQLLLMMSAGD